MPLLPEAVAKQEVEQSGPARKLLAVWRESHPSLCRTLEQKGKLYGLLWERTERMLRQIQQLQQGPRKLSYDQAEEIARHEAQQLP